MWEYLKGPGTQSSSQGPGTDSQCSGSQQHVMICFSSTCWSGSCWLLSLIHRKKYPIKRVVFGSSHGHHNIGVSSFLFDCHALSFVSLACLQHPVENQPVFQSIQKNFPQEFRSWTEFFYVIFSPIFKTLLNCVQFWMERKQATWVFLWQLDDAIIREVCKKSFGTWRLSCNEFKLRWMMKRILA